MCGLREYIPGIVIPSPPLCVVLVPVHNKRRVPLSVVTSHNGSNVGGVTVGVGGVTAGVGGVTAGVGGVTAGVGGVKAGPTGADEVSTWPGPAGDVRTTGR